MLWRMYGGRHSRAATRRAPRSPRAVVFGQIRLLLSTLMQMEDILDEHDPVTYPSLPADVSVNFRRLGRNAEDLMTAVGNYYIYTEPMRLFGFTIKNHYFAHLVHFLSSRILASHCATGARISCSTRNARWRLVARAISQPRCAISLLRGCASLCISSRVVAGVRGEVVRVIFLNY